MFNRALAAAAIVMCLAAPNSAQAATTEFGDRLPFGIAAAIAGNFITPEVFRPSSALLKGLGMNHSNTVGQRRQAAACIPRAL